MNKRKILVIYTGGTIGMIVDPETKALKPFEFKHIDQQLPMLKLVEADITFKTMLPLIDSSDTNPEFWCRLAGEIKTEYDHYDGFVILHGTDTMAYTASALSFLLENLSKPVILTGSQLPLGVIRTDGRRNILNAISVAADYVDDKPIIQEVCIYFQNNLFRGNRTYKANATIFNAFLSPNYPRLAEIGTNVNYNKPYIENFCHGDLIVHDEMDNSVAILKIFPGLSIKMMDTLLSTPGLRAVVLETYGVGNAPTNEEFLSTLEKAVKKGIIIVNITQCKGGGGVEMGKYLTGKRLADIGILSGHDMITEAAVTKLMYLLGHNFSNEEIRDLMSKSLRGEMTIEE